MITRKKYILFFAEHKTSFNIALLYYLLTIESDYKDLYKDKDSLHWQALRAVNIWKELKQIIYEEVNRVSN